MKQQNIIEKIEKIKKELDQLKLMLQEGEVSENGVEKSEHPKTKGTFDGQFMVTEDGAKHEVPALYAAKAKLVFGDGLKMVQKENRSFFDQFQKVPRKRIEGILNKKEGEWYILSDSGSYKISRATAELNNAQLNDEAQALVPADNVNAPYAALDRIISSSASATAVPETPVSKVTPRVAPKIVEEKIEKPEKLEKETKFPKAEPEKIEKKEEVSTIKETVSKKDDTNSNAPKPISSLRVLTDDDLR